MLPQIMESRLIAGAIFATDASQESSEGAQQKLTGYPGATPGNKKGRIAALRVSCLFSLLRILRHDVIQFASQRH